MAGKENLDPAEVMRQYIVDLEALSIGNAEKIDALCQVLMTLVADPKAGLGHGDYGIWVYQCIYCDADSDSISTLKHTADCPIVQGRKLLVEGR